MNDPDVILQLADSIYRNSHIPYIKYPFNKYPMLLQFSYNLLYETSNINLVFSYLSFVLV